ncbi:MAG: hypothetical protein E6772_13550 [Dysgonomonas sp.]|nr:hypothetical protein [Dysgonomonas sp.]
MKLLLFILSLFAAVPVFGQNVKNKYTSHSTSEGSVYFIKPLKGFENKQISSKLEYDITYLSSNDSLTYNFTFVAQTASPVDSVSFLVNNNKETVPAKMLFISPEKNKWKHRVSLKVPNTNFTELYQNSIPYQLVIYSPKGKQTFSISNKDWQQQTSIVNKVFEIIQYNQY